MRALMSLLPVLALGACATVPMASPQDDQAAKRFDGPPPEKGVLYVFRPGWFGLVRPVDVATVGGTRAQLASNTYLRLDGPPGPGEVTCRIADTADTLPLEVTSGQTRYVEVALRPGWWGPSCKVTEVAADQGQAAVRLGKRVAPL